MEFNLFKNQTRFKIALTLIDKPNGLSIMQMNKILEDVAQATLYRNVNAMFQDKLLKIVKTKKLRSGEENYYALNTNGSKIDEEEWSKASYDEKVNFITYYFMYILQAYQNYYKDNQEEKDKTTFSISKLNLSETEFKNFQTEINDLISKYYNKKQNSSKKEKVISLVIIP